MDWVEYYRKAWLVRGKVFDALLAEETDLARILGRFDRFERDNKFVATDAGGAFGYVPRGQPNDPLSCMAQADEGVSCGVPVPVFAYAEVNTGRLLADFAAGADMVAEIGSGYGRMLFDLWLAGGGTRHTRFVGFEPNESGRRIAEALAERATGMNVRFLAGDLDSFDISPMAGAGRVLLFTHFSVMFQERLADDFFARIAAIQSEVILVFIEPLDLDFGPQGRAIGHTYNRDLFQRFNQAAADGLIEPLYVGRDLYGTGDLIRRLSILAAVKPATPP